MQSFLRKFLIIRIGQTRGILKGKIIENWDDTKRLVASPKFGKTSASLIIPKLQSAGKEIGRLQKSILIHEY